MVFARLQLLAPDARSLLVAGARTASDVVGVARRLAETIHASSHEVQWLDLQPVTGSLNGVAESGTETRTTSDGSTTMKLTPGDVGPTLPADRGIETVKLTATELGDAQRTKSVLSGNEGYTVICGGGILDSAPTLLLAALADGVILVARRARTKRADLSAARAEIDRAGGRLLGAVFVP
jgi:hypothetical protein